MKVSFSIAGWSALTGCLLVGLVAASGVTAQEETSRRLDESRSTPVTRSVVEAGARPAAAPAALDAFTELADIEIDGVPDEAEWGGARVFSGFVQREPVEGASSEYDTEVRVLFGDGAIWVAARMWDPNPETIESRLARRDTRGSFDEFSIHLDPNLDGLTGYIFAVTAANVQRDTYLHNDAQIDDAWDAVWSSAVNVDAEGWTAEMRIPLSQIRYEASDRPQTWGVNFYRRRIANNETTFYSLVSRLRKGIVSQMSRMDNVLVTRPSRRFEVLPYVVSSLRRGPADPGDPFFDGSDTGSRFGVDLSYGLGAAFTLDATINPDFGQVEADPAVINLTAFETFFEERRPFFVEDARVFDFGLSGGSNKLFYSRRVGRSPNGRAPSDADYADVPSNATILGAAKLAGRTSSGLSIGALAAVTGNEFGRGQFGDGSRDDFLVEPRGNFGVVSLAQDFNEGMSQVRGIGTMMRRDLPADGSFDWLPSSAFNGGLRFEHQWNDREWALWGFLAGSHVRGDEEAITRIQNASNHYFDRPDATRFALDPTRKSISGREWRMQLEKRGGEHWTGALWAAEVSKGFQINDLGFSQTAERLDGGFRIGYREIEPGDLFRNYNFSINSFHNWSHEALDDTWSIDSWHRARSRGNYSFNANGQLINYWNVRSSLSYSPQQMSRSATRGGPMMVGPASTRFNVNVSSDRRKAVSFGTNFELNDDRIGEGGRTQIRGDVRVRPSDNVEISVNPRYESARSGDQYVTATSNVPHVPTYGTRYLFADLDRQTFSMQTRLDWTFTPTVSLQLYAQPLLSSGDYLQYKQLDEPETYDFRTFQAGTANVTGNQVLCSGSICEVDGDQYIDFDGDGATDYSFSDRDFNVRSLVGNAVLRWEYRPGSTVFLVWQRRQAGRASTGTFDFGRDLDALFAAPADDTFIIKLNYWLPI